MTPRHIETITLGTCLVMCAPLPPHTRHTRTHFDIGIWHCGAALPSSIGWGGGGFAFVTHFSGGGGGSVLSWGGVELRGVGGCFFFVSQVHFVN